MNSTATGLSVNGACSSKVVAASAFSPPGAFKRGPGAGNRWKCSGGMYSILRIASIRRFPSRPRPPTQTKSGLASFRRAAIGPKSRLPKSHSRNAASRSPRFFAASRAPREMKCTEGNLLVTTATDLGGGDQLLVERAREVGPRLVVLEHPLHGAAEQAVFPVELLDIELAHDLVDQPGRGERAGERKRAADADRRARRRRERAVRRERQGEHSAEHGANRLIYGRHGVPSVAVPGFERARLNSATNALHDTSTWAAPIRTTLESLQSYPGAL